MSLPARLEPVVATVALVRLLSDGRADRQYADATYQAVRAWIEGAGSAPEAISLALAEPSLLAADGQLTLDAFERISAEVQRAEDLVARWRSSGHPATAIATSEYPEHLEAVADAPPLLFAEGAPLAGLAPGVAVVGTRKASDIGKARARRAARALAAAGITVYSGMAEGIDTAAHEGALEAGGTTVAVMGTPIDRRYPASNRGLADRIVGGGGTLVTEFVAGTATHPWHFPRRNKTMSGLSLITLVVEAGKTSGAKLQAVAALRHGRAVYFPQSLVDSQPWALEMVNVGIAGTRANVVRGPDELVEILTRTEHEYGTAVAL